MTNQVKVKSNEVIKNKKGANEMTKQEMREVIMKEMLEVIKYLITDEVLCIDGSEDSIEYFEFQLEDEIQDYLEEFRDTEIDEMRHEALEITLQELANEDIKVYEVVSLSKEEVHYYTTDYRKNSEYIKESIFCNNYEINERQSMKNQVQQKNNELIINNEGVNEMTNNNSEVRKTLLRGGEAGRSLIGTEAYYDLIEEFKAKIFDIAMIIIDNSYLDTICELDELDSLVIDVREFEDFYNEVLDTETKIDIEEDLMEDLVIELKYKEDYIIGYDGDKPKIILVADYYYNNLDFYERNYKDYEFITVRKRLLKGENVLELLNSGSYEYLIDELKAKVSDIAMLKIDNCYWDISNPLEGLDSIITDLPEYQYFYNEVLDRERKLDLEERVMEDLAFESEYNEEYVIGYDDDVKPKIILDDEYYYNNLGFYERNYKDYEFITARKRLLDGEYMLELLYSDSYKDLMDELNVKIFDIAMLIIDNCYLDTTEELEELDSIMVELPEYQDFYNEVINRETKIELEEDLMEDLVIELKYKEDYIIGYKGDKPKIIINARYYDKNRADYEDIEFKKTGPDFI